MIYAMLADGFEEIEAITFIDILRRVDIKIATVSVNNDTTVTGAHGITVLTDYTLSEVDIDNALGLYLPGGMPGTLNLKNNKTLCDKLKAFNKNNKYLIAICAAPMILGELGLLKEKNATCYPSFEQYLHGANHVNDAVCVSDNVLTSKGAGTAHDLAFKYIELTLGKNVADELRESMQYK